MTRNCYLCGLRLKTEDIVEVTVVAGFKELASKTSYCITKPIDAYANTLRHWNCDDPKGENNGD